MAYDPSQPPAHWHPMRSVQEPRPVERRVCYPYHFSAGPMEGDPDRLAQRRREIQQARAGQRTRYALAPEARLEIAPGGVFLEGGSEITLEQLRGEADVLDAQRWMQEFILTKPWPIIIEISPAEVEARNPSAQRSRYRVANRSITGSTRGVLEPGTWVCGDDFLGQKAEPARPFEPFHHDERGNKVAARDATPARPEITGLQVLEGLVARGLVIDTQATNAKESA